MNASERVEPVHPLLSRRSVAGRATLVVLWLIFCFWLVLSPRPAPDPADVSEIGKRFIVGIFFALVVTMVGGLTQPRRWPVKLSRIINIFVLGPMVIAGPAGREGWVYGIDIALAVSIAVVNFGMVTAGPGPPPKDLPRWAMPKRWRRLTEQQQQRPRPRR